MAGDLPRCLSPIRHDFRLSGDRDRHCCREHSGRTAGRVPGQPLRRRPAGVRARAARVQAGDARGRGQHDRERHSGRHQPLARGAGALGRLRPHLVDVVARGGGGGPGGCPRGDAVGRAAPGTLGSAPGARGGRFAAQRARGRPGSVRRVVPVPDPELSAGVPVHPVLHLGGIPLRPAGSGDRGGRGIGDRPLGDAAWVRPVRAAGAK